MAEHPAFERGEAEFAFFDRRDVLVWGEVFGVVFAEHALYKSQRLQAYSTLDLVEL